MLNRLMGFLLLLFFGPLIMVLGFLVWLFSGWPIFYFQDRVGYRKKVFKIIKFRTMVRNADLLKEKYRYLNEVDGPVFKIRNDPRLTKIGKFLSHSGLDEMPQFINMVKGEMVLVGPRPLPIEEESNIKKKYTKRELIKPGIISLWILNGHHSIKFDDWMKSDLNYVNNKKWFNDLMIMIRGGILMWRLFWKELKQLF